MTNILTPPWITPWKYTLPYLEPENANCGIYPMFSCEQRTHSLKVNNDIYLPPYSEIYCRQCTKGHPFRATEDERNPDNTIKLVHPEQIKYEPNLEPHYKKCSSCSRTI